MFDSVLTFLGWTIYALWVLTFLKESGCWNELQGPMNTIPSKMSCPQRTTCKECTEICTEIPHEQCSSIYKMN